MNIVYSFIIGLLVGATIAFFVLKNNPKFLAIEKLGKDQLLVLKKKVEEQLAKI